MKRFSLLFLFFLLFFNILIAKFAIVTTIVPIANITLAIVRDSSAVTPIIPPGVSPHTFSPTPKIIGKINDANLFIMNGAGLDFWAKKLLNNKKNKNIINLSSYVHLIAGKGGNGYNPHIWLSLKNVKLFAKIIDSTLCKMDSQDANYYNMNTKIFIARLDSLDNEIRRKLSKDKNKYFISFHPSWSYFDREYGISEIAIIEKTPGREPTPKDIINIIKKVKIYNIKVLFAEPQLNSKTVKVIASETGSKIKYLDPLGSYGDDYVNFLRDNFLKIEESFHD